LGTRGLRVLLVEDNPSDARLVRELLADCRGDFLITHTDCLAAALDLLTSDATFDVVLLDLCLPDSTGLATVEAVRTAAPSVPFLVMTDLGDDDLAVRAVSEGAQDYLRKGDIEPLLLQRSIRYAVERKAFERQLQHHILHDRATGLPNRVLLEERLTRAMVRRRHGAAFAVLSIELDNHASIRDRYGPRSSDRWAAAMAHRLAALMAPADTLARFGAAHFVALLEEPRDFPGILRFAEQIHEALAAPEAVDGNELFTCASIGITTSDADYDEPEEHLRAASIAMSRALEAGSGGHQVYDAAMHDRVVARLRLEAELRRAVERDEMLMLYQPLVWLPTGEVAGFEALLRWQHPERGLLAPGEFLSTAEDLGLLPGIFANVFPRAVEQLATWQSETRTTPPVVLNVNLSPTQFSAPGLVETITAALSQHEIAPYSLGVEITERLIVADDESAVEVLRELRSRKLRVLLDDFGVGYSSMSCLHRFPIDAIKIDRSFMSRIANRDGSAEIVRAIVNVANALNMGVTAEGIETPSELRFIEGLGVDLAQGYLFAEPLATEAATEALSEGFESGRRSSRPGVPAAKRNSERRSRGRVLLVDDDPANRRLVRMQLEERDFEVTEAADGERCIEQAIRMQPEVILLDIEMPGMDGIETCRRLNATIETSWIPVLFVTGRREDDPTIVEALSAGGNDFLSKDAQPEVLCARISSQVAIGRVQSRLRRMAMTDELTGVFSRRYLFESMRRTLKSASRRERPGVVCLLVDVDHFKHVNDTKGHLEGDRVLAGIAQVMDSCVRETDLVARFGGEEFVVLLPGAVREGALRVAEKIRATVERRCSSTVSIGGAYLGEVESHQVKDRDSLDRIVEQLLHEADSAMYEAKERGRNQVVIRERPVKLCPPEGTQL